MFNYLKFESNSLIKLNGVAPLKKIDNKVLIYNLKDDATKNFNLITFQFQYSLISILLKIFKILNSIYKKKNLEVTNFLYNYDFSNYIKQTICLNNIWNTSKNGINKNEFKKYFSICFIKKRKKTCLNNYIFTKNLNDGENLFNYFLQNKKKSRFKKYKKRIYNYVLEQLKNRRTLKKKLTIILVRYSRKKQRLIPAKSAYYYRYPTKLWSFFKWLRANYLLKPILFHQKFKKNFLYNKKFFNINFFFKENYIDIPKKLKYKKIMNPLLNKKVLLYKALNYNKKKKRYHKLLKNKSIFNQTFFCFNSLYRSRFKYKNFFKNKFKYLKIRKTWSIKKYSYKSYFFMIKNFKTFLIGINFNNLKKLNVNLKNNIFYFHGYVFNKFKISNSKLNYVYLYKNSLYVLLTKLTKETIYFKSNHITLLNYLPTFNSLKIPVQNFYKNFLICLFFIKFIKFECFKNKYTFLGQEKFNAIKQQSFNLHFFSLKLTKNFKTTPTSIFFLNYSKHQNIKYLNNLLFLY